MPGASSCFLLFLCFRKVVQEKSQEKSTKNQGVLIIHGEGVRQKSPGGGLPRGHAGARRGPTTTRACCPRVRLVHPLASPFCLHIPPPENLRHTEKNFSL